MTRKLEFHSTIAVRAFASSKGFQRFTKGSDDIGHSEWSLTFDTETTTDAAQRLRFGVFELRKRGALRKRGVFFDEEVLTPEETDLLKTYCAAKHLLLLTVTEFIDEIFFPYVYLLDALCIGFNLPFDLSRLAIGHAPARGSMRGGFSFHLSLNKYSPRLQIKHLDSRASLIQFALPPAQNRTRGMRKCNDLAAQKRGYFLDVRTLASALLSGSWSLASLAEHLNTCNQKHKTDEHGQELTAEYLDYAVQDVQVTWECFEVLRSRYDSMELDQTPITRIYSEASVGKAYLRHMGIRPFSEKQPDFSPNVLGAIMSSYYGGRAEVKIRREVVQVLYCDFLSMYPTVCTLMDLWKFNIAEHMEQEDVTLYVSELLENLKIDDVRKPEFWKKLNVLVQILPEDDILPVRARYARPPSNQRSIGINYLTNHKPMWFTLGDCIASTLLSGRSPKVIKAVRFVPVSIHSNLKPIALAGKRIDPKSDDFYKVLIDRRNTLKVQMKASSGSRRAKLDADQTASKICANATSYGIYVELNTKEHDRNQRVDCYGYDGLFETDTKTTEEPGQYFHPVLATFITGGARLMLAVTEVLAERHGISWAFCDTDSMALAKPHGMDQDDFLKRAREVSEWFTPLNPYELKGPLLKIEDENYAIENGELTGEISPLYCLAISAKRYALFNLSETGKPTIRKASRNGLGYLLPPKRCDRLPPDTLKSVVLKGSKLEEWEYDLWAQLAESGSEGSVDTSPLTQMSVLNQPGVSRYAATTPGLLRWFSSYNTGKAYADQVKPFNFLLCFQPNFDSLRVVDNKIYRPAPIAPYDSDFERAVLQCFDRRTWVPVPRAELKTYLEILSQFHLHPDAKFINADYSDSGITLRRHVIATAIEHIGKESNRLEEQWYTGVAADAQIQYGSAPSDLDNLITEFIEAARRFGTKNLAKAAGLSVGHVRRILTRKSSPSDKMILKLRSSIRVLEDST